MAPIQAPRPGMQRDVCGGGCYALANGKPALELTLRHVASQLARRWEQRQVSLSNLEVQKHPNQAVKHLAILRDMERCGKELAKIREQVKESDPDLACEIEAHPAYKRHAENLAALARHNQDWLDSKLPYPDGPEISWW